MTMTTEQHQDAASAGQDAADAAEQALALTPSMGALATTESAREIAMVQARALLARQFPRDEGASMESILTACSRLNLAQKATYLYTRAGEEITGPTIRLAEAVAQAWGNMRVGVRELSRDMENGVSVCIAFAEDQQTGFSDEREFHVRHWRDRRNGKPYRVTSDRDIRELVANYGARSKRAAIETVIPKWVFEEAVEACENTVLDNVRTDEQAIASMLERFAEVGVFREHLEDRIRCPLEQVTPQQLIALLKIYNALKGGDALPGDYFNVATAAATEPSPANTLDAIVARGQSRVAARTPPPPSTVKTKPAQEVERLLREARTPEALNAASVKIGPIKDMDDKGALYDLWDARRAELGVP